jgi:hypothetical protein
MGYLQIIFKAISVTFALAAVYTGVHGLVYPAAFSKFFGLPLDATTIPPPPSSDSPFVKSTYEAYKTHRTLAKSYISLMSVRQLGTGIILLIFAYQDKWTEVATILAVIGVLVAGTDGLFLIKGSTRADGIFHAIPGGMISALAVAFMRSKA